MSRLIWNRDYRFGCGPTYSAVYADFYLYAGFRSGDRCTFSIHHGKPGGRIGSYQGPEVIAGNLVYESGNIYYNQDEAIEACEKYFLEKKMSSEKELPPLCEECFTRHEGPCQEG